jgi:acetolactate synthase-1/2/3 large subunit
MKRVVKELKTAKRPLLCVGGGVHLAGASEVIRQFATKHQIPVVSTMMGIGVMPSLDPLYFGMVGNNGLPLANQAMNQSDLLLMVGARVADRAVSQPGLISKNKILVHIDVDPAEIGKNAGPSIPLVGDAKHIFEHLLAEEFTADYAQWLESFASERKQALPQVVCKDLVNPGVFLHLLSMEMKDDAVYVADVGQNQIWSCRYHVVKNGRFFTSGGMGTMGYSIPAAMGAKVADPERQVVAVCGDGSFQMSMMELATMRQHHIPIKIIVFNNTTLGMVREYQHFTYQDHYTMVDLSGSPNLEKIAQAYDMKFLRLETGDKAMNQDMIRELLSTDEAVLMECRINPLAEVKYPAQELQPMEGEVMV